MKLVIAVLTLFSANFASAELPKILRPEDLHVIYCRDDRAQVYARLETPKYNVDSRGNIIDPEIAGLEIFYNDQISSFGQVVSLGKAPLKDLQLKIEGKDFAFIAEFESTAPSVTSKKGRVFVDSATQTMEIYLPQKHLQYEGVATECEKVL